MGDDSRRRSACDRCHSQKLRCPRRPGEATCDRCVKARTSCIFSPFRQKKPSPEDPSSATVSSQVPATTFPIENLYESFSNGNKRKRVNSNFENIDIDPNILFRCSLPDFEQSGNNMMNDEWPSESLTPGQDFTSNYTFDTNVGSQNTSMSLNMDSIIPNSPQWQQPKESNLLQFPKESPPPQPVSNLSWIVGQAGPRSISHVLAHGWDSAATTDTPESTSDLIRDLSDLSIRLFDHSEHMPPLSIHDPGPTDATKDYTSYSVDELFQLTQSVIDVYPCFLNTFFGSQSSQASSPDSMTESSGGSTGTNVSTPQNQRSNDEPAQESSRIFRKAPPDHSSILLMLSCHLRLIGIYQLLFKHMKVCAGQNGIAHTPGQIQATFSVPQLRVGSYRPPPSSAIPMQMVLFVHFASQLSSYAADFATEVQGQDSGEPFSMSIDDQGTLSRAAAEDVKGRAKDMFDELGKVRNEMLSMGLVV